MSRAVCSIFLANCRVNGRRARSHSSYSRRVDRATITRRRFSTHSHYESLQSHGKLKSREKSMGALHLNSGLPFTSPLLLDVVQSTKHRATPRAGCSELSRRYSDVLIMYFSPSECLRRAAIFDDVLLSLELACVEASGFLFRRSERVVVQGSLSSKRNRFRADENALFSCCRCRLFDMLAGPRSTMREVNRASKSIRASRQSNRGLGTAHSSESGPSNT